MDHHRGRLEPDGEIHGTAGRRLVDAWERGDSLPGMVRVPDDYWPPSSDYLAELQRRFEERNTPAARAAHNRREMRRLLTRRTRLRLWWRKQMTAAGLWSSR